MSSYDERCVEHGVKDMRLEAEAIVSDVLFAVSDMFVSKTLTNGLDLAFINVETREGKRYCLELSEAGLRVSGNTLPAFLNGLFLIPLNAMFRCVALHCIALQVVGHTFDQVDAGLSTPYHETVYSLLDSLSPGYREAFGNALLQRLERLKQNGQ